MKNRIAPVVNVRHGHHEEAEEAALLVLVIGDVEGVEEGLHAVVGAPERQEEPHREAEAERIGPGPREAGQFLVEEVDHGGREEAAQILQVLLDRDRIGDEAVEGDESRERGEKRQHDEEGGAGRDGADTVVGNLVLDPVEDVLPPQDGDLGRRPGLASTADLPRPVLVDPHRHRIIHRQTSLRAGERASRPRPPRGKSLRRGE